MKRIANIWNPLLWCLFLLTAGPLGGQGWAAEDGAGGWRGTYDLVMMWVNFGILAFVIVKYGRRPIMEFILGRKEELAREIKRIEANRDEAVKSLEKTLAELEAGSARLEALKTRILEQAEKARQSAVEEAREQSRYMIETARRKVEGQIQQAQAAFRGELIDAAIAKAMEKLPALLNDRDNQKFLDEYLKATTAN